MSSVPFNLSSSSAIFWCDNLKSRSSLWESCASLLNETYEGQRTFYEGELEVTHKELEVRFVPNVDQIANVLTKPISQTAYV